MVARDFVMVTRGVPDELENDASKDRSLDRLTEDPLSCRPLQDARPRIAEIVGMVTEDSTLNVIPTSGGKAHYSPHSRYQVMSCFRVVTVL